MRSTGARASVAISGARMSSWSMGAVRRSRRAIRSRSRSAAIKPRAQSALIEGQNLIVIEETGQAYGRKVLQYQGRTIGQVYADYDISHLLRERRTVLGTLVATNTAFALMLAALGYWAIRRMLAPLGRAVATPGSQHCRTDPSRAARFGRRSGQRVRTPVPDGTMQWRKR